MIIVLLFIVGIEIFQLGSAQITPLISNTSTPSLRAQPTLVNSVQHSSTTGTVVNSFIDLKNSLDLDKVTKKLASVNLAQSKYSISKGSASLDINFYKIPLTNDSNYQKLVKFFTFDFYPSTNTMTLDNQQWKAYSYTEASEIYTKQGFACILLRQNRFNAEPFFECAKASDFKNNTLQVVQPFMNQLFIEAGMLCQQNCNLSETQDRMDLPGYSREVLYFDKNIIGEEKKYSMATSVLEKLKQDLITINWQTKTENNTAKEQKYGNGITFSYKLSTNTQMIQCADSITFASYFGKRDMITCSYTLDGILKVQNSQ